MRKKRFLSVVLTASMILGSSVSAFASSTIIPSQEATKAPATGSATGKAQVEGYLNTEIFKVEVPTVSVNKSIFNFVMDPQGLIASTNAARYTNGKGDGTGFVASANGFDEGTLYFAYLSGNNTTLSPSSNAITITNKSTFAVDATLKAEVGTMGDLEISTNAATAQKPSIQLSLSDNKGASDAIKGTTVSEAAVLSETISGCDGDYSVSFNVSGNGGKGAYEYALSSNSGNFADYSFHLTGASGGGDYTSWSAISEATKTARPTVNVTWEIVPYVAPAGASITGGITTFKIPTTQGQAIKIPLSLGTKGQAATKITSITAGSTTVPTTGYEYADGILKIKASYYQTITATTMYTINFDKAPSTPVTFTIQK